MVAFIKNTMRNRLLPGFCFTAALFAAAPAAYAQDDSDVLAVQGQSCAVDRYNAVNSSNKTTLNCTANDFVATASATSPAGQPCPTGTVQPINLDIQISSGNATRYDAAIFIPENGGNPNSLGGTCSIATFPTTNLIAGNTSWFDATPGNVNNTCGDYNSGSNTFNLIEQVKVLCQYDNTNKLSIPFMLTYGNAQNSTCTGAADNATHPASAGTVAKCNSVAVSVGNVPVTFNADPACTKQVSFDAATLTVTGTIHLVNNDPANQITADGAPNVTFEDVVPGPVVVTGAICTNQSPGAQCPQDVVAYPPLVVSGNDVYGQIPFLPPGGSVDIIITGTIPSLDSNIEYVNTGTVLGLLPNAGPGATDPKLSFPADVAQNDTCQAVQAVQLPVKLQSFDVK